MNFSELRKTQLFQRVKDKIITNTQRVSIIKPGPESKIDDLILRNREIHSEFSRLLKPLRETKMRLSGDELNRFIADLKNLEKKIDYIESYFLVELDVSASPEY